MARVPGQYIYMKKKKEPIFCEQVISTLKNFFFFSSPRLLFIFFCYYEICLKKNEAKC